MALERIEIKLPAGFDPARHAKALPAVIAKSRGDGWEIESIDPARGIATLTRQVALMEVKQKETDGAEPEAFEIRLPAGTKPADGDRVAARQADAHPGYALVRFEPHVGKAVLAKLTDDELRCRGAVANALGVKPWDVMVRQRKDGGYSLQLPGAYAPSKHDTKLTEVAESIVGRYGWYVTVDARTLVAQIIPSEPPTFPPMVELPMKTLGSDLMRTPFGVALPRPGEKAKDVVSIDWKAQAFGLVSGLPGGGKSVVLNDLIADSLAAGAELIICNVEAKAVDYLWCKDLVRDGGWGCEGLRSTVTAMMLMYEEGERRAAWMAENGFNNWIDIPEKQRFKPILAIVDEVAALLVTERLPPGVDKNLPEVQEIIEENRLRFKLQRRIQKVIAEQRFVGMRAVLSTQVSNQSTGLPPTLKSLLGQKILMGSNPSKTQRQQSFNVETAVPAIPPNLVGGGPAARGIGAAELEGQTPVIFKGFFASTDDLRAELLRRGVRRTTRPSPTLEEMDRLCPVGDMDEDDVDSSPITLGELTPSGKPVSSLDPKFGPVVSYDADGNRLKGAAAAAHQSKLIADADKASGVPRCFSCDMPIAPNGDCGCS